MPQDPPPPPRRPSSLRLEGVAKVLADVKQGVHDDMVAKLRDLRSIVADPAFAQVQDETLTLIASWAGTFAHTRAGNGVAEAHQIGINKSATAADHERPTRPTPPPIKGT